MGMCKFRVGDRVRTIVLKDCDRKRFIDNTEGVVLTVLNPFMHVLNYEIRERDSSKTYWYSEDELELVEVCETKVETKTYEQGLEEAWKMADRLTIIPYDLRNEIFGVDDATNGVRDILRNFTAAEIIEKYRRWEDSHLSVGDVVKVNVTKSSIYSGVVTHISDNRESLSILFDDGSVGSVNVKMYEIRKTGQHIDISELLNNIGKES